MAHESSEVVQGKLTQSPARFIAFEGIDGCGKTTVLSHCSRRLDRQGVSHIVTREPGGTPIGEKIRELLLDPSHASLDQRAEVLLYTASRAQHARERIAPALEKGVWVLADRYADATLAYQGYGRGLGPEILRPFQEWATRGLWPHLTVLLDCPAETAWSRRKNRGTKEDRLEQESPSFHESVRRGYLELARAEPGRFLILDASRDLEEVLEDFDDRLALRFKPCQ